MITEIFDSTLSPIPTISKFNNKRTTDVIQINNVLNRKQIIELYETRCKDLQVEIKEN